MPCRTGTFAYQHPITDGTSRSIQASACADALRGRPVSKFIAMHVVPVPYNAAWMPFDARLDKANGQRLASWLTANERGDRSNRVVVTPQKSHNYIDDPPVLAALARRSQWVSARSDRVPWGGPVVAAWPTEETLARCVSRAGDRTSKWRTRFSHLRGRSDNRTVVQDWPHSSSRGYWIPPVCSSR